MSSETCKKTIQFSGKLYAIGDPIEIDDANEVTRLKNLGALVDGDAVSVVGVGDAASIEQIVDAIQLLDEDGFTDNGKPKIASVRELTGELTVSNDDLNTAIAKIQAEQE